MDDEVAALSGGSSTLGQRVGTLESEMDEVQSKNTQQDSQIGGLTSRMTTAEGDIDTLQSDMTQAKSDIDAVEAKNTTQDGQISKLQTDMTSTKSRLDKLEDFYETNVVTSSWSGSTGNYTYSIPATTHNRGTRPRVHTYVNGEETYDSPTIDWSTGNVTLHSNAQVAMKVLIY